MKEPNWLSRALVLAIHDEMIAVFGGEGDLRDSDLLDSALDRPRNLFTYGNDPTLFDLAAVLCHGLAKNHPFLDGNKRTALLAARAFLFLNGYAFEPNEVDEVEMMVRVADGRIDQDTLAPWFKRFSQKRK